MNRYERKGPQILLFRCRDPHASPTVSETHQTPRAVLPKHVLSSGPFRDSLLNMNQVIGHLRQASNIKTEIKKDRIKKFRG